VFSIFRDFRFLPGWAVVIAAVAVVVCFASVAHAGVGGSISGTVEDSSGAGVPRATVTATSVTTGVQQTVATDERGAYAFLSLPIGRYEVQVTCAGFKPSTLKDLVIDANSTLRVDARLDIGARTDTVTVTGKQVQMDSTTTQMGDVIAGSEITAVPLNGRSFTDLLALQPGVVPVTSITSETVQDVGATVLSPSGDLNPGTISINGQREFANSFLVNGSDVEEDVNMGAAIVPNLDSIAEFRILTNNFDAEYGEFSGGQINVVTKSGTNAFHGDLFEFVRSTDLDARNYFSPTRGVFDQNQFGGTFGGPIRRNKIFFFADYQGTRSTQGIATGQIPVPSIEDRTTGNMSDQINSQGFDQLGFCGSQADPVSQQVFEIPCTVSGPQIATMLSSRLGYPVTAGEPYYFNGNYINPATGQQSSGRCTTTGLNGCVFPNATVPPTAWASPGTNLLQYIPRPNQANGTFSTSVYNQTLRDDKGAYRIDANTRWGLLTAYYFLDDWSQNNPYPVAQGGANVPGFNALYSGRAQLLNLADTKTLGPTAVNEFHLSYLRDANDLGKPIGGVGVSLASQGFVVGPGTLGIVPLSPETEGVESVTFNSFTLGTNTNELNQTNNTFQWLDNFSKAIGNHTIKLGGEFHYDQVNVHAIAQFNGSFLFLGNETGLDFADFLVGTPTQYNQSQLQPFYGRNRYIGLYGQDSWRLTPRLTLNYGLRWDRIEPWYENYNQIATFVAGKQSLVFPGAPAGILYPTDPGVPRTLAPAGNLDFAPRLGLAYSPGVSGGVLGKIFGGPGQTSIRASYGLFYTAIEALTINVMSANAPYGTTYTSPAPPLFPTPFVVAATGDELGQTFPVTLATWNSTRGHPDSTIDWSQFEPISGLPNYLTTNRIPYTEQYMLSIERALGPETVLGLSYVGSQGHRLLVLEEANPGDPSLCLFLGNPANLAPGQIPCGPFGEDRTYVTRTGAIYNGTRGPLGSSFGSNANQATIGNSNYNAFEVTLRHNSRRLELLAGYTYSKSQDQASNLGEEVNPFDPALSKALSAFDLRHNLVVSYSYQIPLERLLRASNRFTEGWQISGITRVSSGLPVTLVNFGDNSLIGSEPNGVNNSGVDEPDFTPGNLDLNGNPPNGRPYFNTALFSENALGTAGTSKRRFFSGPGMVNFDVALSKNLRLTESKFLEFRVEAFNVFNHTQFFGPQAVDGNIASSTFGQVLNAAAPRLLQAAAKFNF
jgi:Carboxypeptidase regulatory-like domain/TonB dependent receptor-like, beta-barrel